MYQRLDALVIAIACLLTLPGTALAQLPMPTYGWNLGNTLEPPSGEGTWNNPPVSQAMINAIADSGFNTIRIPVAWNSHANQTAPYTINSAWMARVKQVVDWSLAADLTVVINTHWDNGWFENSNFNTFNSVINAKVSSHWTQISNAFAGYDERLLFAVANEPAVDTAAEMSTLASYYQTFVNAVRATGGSNTSRWLVVQGPTTDIDLTDSLMNTLPSDPTADRLAVEVHYYSPYQFTLMTADQPWGNQFYFWGEDYHSTTLPEHNPTWGEEDYLIAQLQKMHTKFVSQGVPVILGEFGAIKRANNSELSSDPNDLALHLASRTYFHQQVTDIANSMGIAPIYWDNGVSSEFSLFDRNSTAVIDPDMVSALTGGGFSPGDFDKDGDVDGADFLMWQLGELTVPLSQFDLAAWEEHYGTPPPLSAASTSVPEPTGLAVAWLATVLSASFRSRASVPR